MSLTFIAYLAGISGGLQAFFGFISVPIGILTSIYFISYCSSLEYEREQAKNSFFGKNIRNIVLVGLICGFITVIIPNKYTIISMVAANYIETGHAAQDFEQLVLKIDQYIQQHK